DPEDPSRLVLRTGDHVRLRRDGLLEYAGRVDAMVKIRGNRVEPAEIEEALRRDPAVADVAILASASGAGTTLIAYVVPRKPGDPSLREALRERLGKALPAYMVPARIELLKALPRLPGGKLDLRALAPGAAPGGQSGGMRIGETLGNLRRLWARRP